MKKLLTYMDHNWWDTGRLSDVVGRFFWAAVRCGEPMHLLGFGISCTQDERRRSAAAVRPWRDSISLVNELPNGVTDGTNNVSWRALIGRARLLAAADLRAFDREDDRFGRTSYDSTPAGNDFGNDDRELRARFGLVERFH